MAPLQALCMIVVLQLRMPGTVSEFIMSPLTSDHTRDVLKFDVRRVNGPVSDLNAMAFTCRH